MSCDHSPPQFGCRFCVEKRGKIYENNLDYYMHQLSGARELLGTTYDEEDMDKVYHTIDTVMDEIEEVLLNVCTEAKLDSAQGLFHNFVANISRANSYKRSNS